MPQRKHERQREREPEDDVSSPWEIITQGRRRSRTEIAVWALAFIAILIWVGLAGMLSDALGIEHGLARAAVRASAVVLIMLGALRIAQRMEP
jgi:type VI protein secretion system component VasF